MSNFGKESSKQHSCDYFKIRPPVKEKKSFKVLLFFFFLHFLALVAIFSAERNGLSDFVRGSPNNIPVTLFQNPSSRFGGKVLLDRVDDRWINGRRIKAYHNTSS